MSILIKGMEMPRNCAECFFHKVFPATGVGINQLYCALCGINIVKLSDAQPDCPLVPFPPHGRLIDADALMNEFEKAQRTMQQHGREYSCSFLSSSQELSTEWYCVEDMLENAPTVIEAEEEEP